VAKALYNLAALYHARGDYTQAEPLYKKSIHAYENPNSSQDYHKLLDSLTQLADEYQRQGNDRESAALYKRLVSIQGKFVKPDSASHADALEGYAELLRVTKRADDAVFIEQQAKSIRSGHGNQTGQRSRF
jgi:tetratricopeptide (TPR) repeat protein